MPECGIIFNIARTYSHDIIDLASGYFEFTPVYREEFDEINELWQKKIYDSMNNTKRHHSDVTRYKKRKDEINEKYSTLKKWSIQAILNPLQCRGYLFLKIILSLKQWNYCPALKL